MYKTMTKGMMFQSSFRRRRRSSSGGNTSRWCGWDCVDSSSLMGEVSMLEIVGLTWVVSELERSRPGDSSISATGFSDILSVLSYLRRDTGTVEFSWCPEELSGFSRSRHKIAKNLSEAHPIF